MNNKFNIGVSLAVNTGKDNWERIQDLINHNFNHIELYNKIIRVRFEDVGVINELKNAKGISFSFHSMVQDLFCKDSEIAAQEYYTLRGEIKLASLINCSRVIFHIIRKEELNDSEIEQLRELADYANRLNVMLCLENAQSGISSGEYLFKLFDKINNLKFCLDIGHLNIAVNKGYVKNIEFLIKNIADKIVELHLSYNNGQKDEHKEIESPESLDYLKRILKIVKIEQVILLIETKNFEQAKKTLESLEKLEKYE